VLSCRGKKIERSNTNELVERQKPSLHAPSDIDALQRYEFG
jgi:hypothetical protein